MRQVAVVEDRIGTAQTGLCEHIDRTMSILDRSHLDWSPESHWCTRWGRLAKFYLRVQDAASSSPTLSSRSSSRDSFYSAPSEPTVPGDYNATPTGLFNFLGLAASHNLSLYVHHLLECSQREVSSETLDFLLYCSTFSEDIPELRVQAMSKIVLELLRRGANPNARFMGNTAWNNFLKHFIQLWIWSLRHVMRFPLVGTPAIQHLALATIAFVEHGADVGLVWSNRNCLLPFGSEPPFSGCWCDLQASPLSTIELCMRHDPEILRIRKLCDDRGAIRYLRCTTLGFDVYRKTEEGGRLSKQFKLSEQESEDFLGIFKSSFEPSGAYVVGATAKVARQISDFYTRL